MTNGIESNFDGWGDVIDPPPHMTEKSFQELVERLSGKAPVKQILLTSNPEPSGWIIEYFKLGE